MDLAFHSLSCMDRIGVSFMAAYHLFRETPDVFLDSDVLKCNKPK